MLSTKFGTGWMVDGQQPVVAPPRMRLTSHTLHYRTNAVEKAHRRVTRIAKHVTRAEEIQVTDGEQGSNEGIMDDGNDDTEVTNQEAMAKTKPPKVIAILLFMQEQRARVPGWADKSNREFQVLCDSLWKKLSKEEKAKYKDVQKSLEKREREARVQVRIEQEAKRVEFEGKHWPVPGGESGPCLGQPRPLTLGGPEAAL